MRSLRYLSTRIFGLIVSIFVLSGGQSVDAMGLEARVKDLHGSLVSLKKKLTSLRDGLQEVKNSLAGKAYSGKRKRSVSDSGFVVKSLKKSVKPLPSIPTSAAKPRPTGLKKPLSGKKPLSIVSKKPIVLPLSDMIKKLINDSNRWLNCNNMLHHANKNTPLVIHQAFEKMLQGNQDLLEDSEARILALVIGSLEKNLSPENLVILNKIKNKMALTKDELDVFKYYYKLYYNKTSEAQALFAKIKPKITMTEVAPSSGSSPVSGPAPLVTPVESLTPPVSGPKSPPPAPKLPNTPLSSGGSKSTPVKKPSVSGPAPVSITDQIKSKGMGYLKKLSEEDIEKDKARRAEELAKKQQEKDKVAGEASTQTKAAAADSMFESLKANLGKRAEAIQGSDDDDEYPPGYWD